MTTTPNLQIDHIATSQTQKEVTPDAPNACAAQNGITARQQTMAHGANGLIVS